MKNTFNYPYRIKFIVYTFGSQCYICIINLSITNHSTWVQYSVIKRLTVFHVVIYLSSG